MNVFGKWLEKKREQMGMRSRRTFARNANVSETLVYELESGRGLPFHERRDSIRTAIAHTLRVWPLELDAFSRGSGVEPADSTYQPPPIPSTKPTLPTIDPNIEPYSEQASRPVPTFNVAVAAGQWVEVTEVAELREPKQIDHGFFRIRIRGDSMSPKFKDGSLIEFKCLRNGRDRIEVGQPYYVQRSDGMATFKIVEGVDDDELVLRAINRRKYPDAMTVLRVDVSRMAKAEFTLKPA